MIVKEAGENESLKKAKCDSKKPVVKTGNYQPFQ